MTRPLLFAALAPLVGCGFEVGTDGVNLLVPDDVEVRWDHAFNRDDDGLAALVPVDLMVYDAQSGEGVEGVTLEMHGAEPGALLVFPDAVSLVEPEDCDQGECVVWWDAWRDGYFELAESPSHAGTVETDPTGLARLYLFVDAFPYGGDDALAPATVTVTLGEVDESFSLVPR